MRTIIECPEGVYNEFKDDKEMMSYFKSLFINCIGLYPILVFMGLMIGLILVSLFALGVYLFLTHIDFFLFDIPIMFFDWLAGGE